MCLGIPGKIVAIYSANGLQMGKVDFGGVVQEVCLSYVPEAEVGQYTVIHVGFALNVLDEAEALETLALLRQMGAAQEELELMRTGAASLSATPCPAPAAPGVPRAEGAA